MSNLDANELPDEADQAAGFEPKASLKKLGAGVKKGQNAAGFAIVANHQITDDHSPI